MTTPELPHQFAFSLPDWVAEVAANAGALATPEARMQLAIALSRANVERGSGGPFGAVVVDLGDKRLVAAGVNLVRPAGASVLHAEVVALSLAQQALGTHDLSGKGRFELATSCEPCAMCIGAIPWSGVAALAFGANDADARAIGFDEGHKPFSWTAALEQAGVKVTAGVCCDDAAAVLKQYAAAGKPLY